MVSHLNDCLALRTGRGNNLTQGRGKGAIIMIVMGRLAFSVFCSRDWMDMVFCTCCLKQVSKQLMLHVQCVMVLGFKLLRRSLY